MSTTKLECACDEIREPYSTLKLFFADTQRLLKNIQEKQLATEPEFVSGTCYIGAGQIKHLANFLTVAEYIVDATDFKLQTLHNRLSDLDDEIDKLEGDLLDSKLDKVLNSSW